MIEVSRAMYIGYQDESTPARAPRMDEIGRLREVLWETITELYWWLEEG
jgi:hypothetical protein